jgi:hypothetical protein
MSCFRVIVSDQTSMWWRPWWPSALTAVGRSEADPMGGRFGTGSVYSDPVFATRWYELRDRAIFWSVSRLWSWYMPRGQPGRARRGFCEEIRIADEWHSARINAEVR